ncbi:MAG: pirin family protein [Betaproteobacteria bacterium]|nr:pirin family protein [Betaproteobacteria bacterium]
MTLADTVTTTRLRGVERIITAHVAPVGTFTVKRALPDSKRHSVGPWVFLDHFGPFTVNPGGRDGVGPHPHAGIETVTYLLDGRNEHRDSAGHTGIVSAGGAQWMTAGKGIVHAERPLPEGDGPIVQHGIQLWTTLPRALKMAAPGYQRIAAAEIPTLTGDGWTVRVVAGEFQSAGLAAQGPAKVLMPLLLWHVRLESGAALTANIRDEHEVAAYVIAGRGRVAGQDVEPAQLAVLANEPGGIELTGTGDTALELMVLGGTPAEGPLVFHGPFVMNSVEQVRHAERAYLAGEMGALSEA